MRKNEGKKHNKQKEEDKERSESRQSVERQTGRDKEVDYYTDKEEEDIPR